MSLVLVVVIAVGTWSLLRDSVNMSLQAAPPRLDPNEIGTFLREREGVQAIHDLHVWPMSTTETALTVHLLVLTGYPGDDFTAEIAAALKDKFGVGHATIQIETDAATPCELEADRIEIKSCERTKSAPPFCEWMRTDRLLLAMPSSKVSGQMRDGG